MLVDRTPVPLTGTIPLTGSSGLRERRAAFDARTEQYLRAGHDRFAASDFVAAAAGPLTGPVLDIGTGRGLTAIALARRRVEVISVDIDLLERELAEMLAAEAGMSRSIRFIHGTAASLPFSDGMFGCVAMMDVLHHLPDPRPVLSEAVRVLKPSGVYILAEFSAEGFKLVESVHRAGGGQHPVSGVTIEQAAAMLRDMGVGAGIRNCGHMHDVMVLMKQGGTR
ncbi:MAG: class I SAM-dependent methyltransferase [Candidatus Edwardsbacteria bacterium]|jgi:ubiquinone/menaquinone biosynthesis C-methylase UbiE|nr:class I SAM-dependent methyltransferase [Candidatus Edwardsbacteria bacterium]